MATLSANYPTLQDLVKTQDDAGNVMPVVDMLAQMSVVLRTVPAVTCNHRTRHRTTIVDGIPNPTWVQYYERINPGKTTTHQVEDVTGRMKGMTSIDRDLLKSQKDPERYRLIQANGVLEGFAQEFESSFFYGDTDTSPLEFLGLAPRMDNLSAVNARQIVDAGGTGSDNTSIFICGFGENSGHLIVPEGMGSGVMREDKGEQRDSNASGVIYYVEEEFQQHAGFSMSDWRYFVRIANIDVSNLSTGSAADLVDLFITGMYRLQSRKGAMAFEPGSNQPVRVKPVAFCNTTIKEFLHKQMLRQPNGFLRPGEFFGEEVMMLDGMPLLETDGIVNTEARVT